MRSAILKTVVKMRPYRWVFVAALGCGDAAGDAPGSGSTGPSEPTSGSVSETNEATGSDEADVTGPDLDSSGGAVTGPDLDSSGGADSDGTTGEGGEEFCPPELSESAAAWREEYDVFFADADSMRTYLDAFEEGSGHWGQTYTSRSLVLMYELTGAVEYLHELIWQTDRLMALAGDAQTWPTGVCSNTFEHSTLVIDARLLVPMLRGAWWMASSRLADDPIPQIDGLELGVTYGGYAEQIGAFAQAVLEGHDADRRTIASEGFGPYEGSASDYYVFPGSYSCVAGEVQPFNYLNSAGQAWAELWRLTGSEDARERAERLMVFWWNRTYAYEPSPGATRSRWWGYRGKLDERFDPDAFPGDSEQRPEDVGHADMSSSFAARVFALGLEGQNGTRIDQVAMASKRWVDRAVGQGNPSYYITNDDEDGEWDDMFDHLPMACHRGSILEALEPLAADVLTNDQGDYRRSYVENLAELAFFSEYAGAARACGPSCGDGVCGGPEDCVGCPEDCACPQSCP